MRPETEHIVDDLQIQFPGKFYADIRRKIVADIVRGEIRNEYHHLYAKTLKSSAVIKRYLAIKYHVSVSTIEKYIYGRKRTKCTLNEVLTRNNP